jgi:hypothetical protein
MIDCAAFDDGVAELALEILEPAERDALLAHAAGCDRCRAELQLMAATADRVLLIAPEAEPPVGFEQRAVATMSAPRRWVRPVLLAAAAAVVLFAAGLVLGRGLAPDHRAGTEAAAFRQATLVDAGGREHGAVSLSTHDGLVLTMSLRSLDAGLYRCVVLRKDGSATEVAAWPVSEGGTGVWAVAVSGTLADITGVRVTESDGTAVATASLG